MRTRAKETAIEKPVELMEMAEAVLVNTLLLAAKSHLEKPKISRKTNSLGTTKL